MDQCVAFNFSKLIISIIIIISINIIIVKPTFRKQNAIASFKDCLRYFSCKAFETFFYLKWVIHKRHIMIK